MVKDVFCKPEGIYTVLVRSGLWIPTPGFNQFSQGESGKCSSPVCLLVRPVGGCYSLSVRGLALVLVISCLVMKKMIATQVRLGSGSRQAGVFYVLSGRCNRPSIFTCFFVVFVPHSTTFANNPKVVESVCGAVSVEQPH